MTENMETLLPQIPIILITAAVTLISVYLTNLGHSKREREQFQRSEKQSKTELRRIKLEELYILFSNWGTDVSALYMTFVPVILGAMAEKDAWKITQNNKLSENGSYQRISMIIHMYFPQLVDDLSDVLKSRDKISGFLGENRPKDKDTKEFLQAYDSFDKTIKEFKEKIAGISNAL
jgi:hypothetical protein